VVKDGFGRRAIRIIPDDIFEIEADMVVPAVSQYFDLPFIDRAEFAKDEKGVFSTNEETQMTSVAGVFAGGDMVRGSDTAIQTIADGKNAAVNIDKYLGGSGILNTGEEVKTPDTQDESSLFKHERYDLKYLPIEERKHSFDEAVQGYAEKDAIAEARRCLRCDTQIKASVDKTKCMDCALCVEFCPQGACSMELLDTPRIIKVAVNPEHMNEIAAICKKAHVYPLYTACPCTGTTAAEVVEAILQGAKQPKEVTKITGFGTGCGGIYCMTTVQNLLEAAGHKVQDRGDGMYYDAHINIWQISEEVADRYPVLSIARDQKLYFKPELFDDVPSLFDVNQEVK
jgi:bacterioferritin-associated ferredoxin/NAD-dependent dihydropyrimidine dehydrogenase PreA subunit